MPIVAIRTGIRSIMILDRMAVQQPAYQMGWKEDVEVDSPVQEVGPSENSPWQWYLLSNKQEGVVQVVDTLDLLMAWVQ